MRAACKHIPPGGCQQRRHVPQRRARPAQMPSSVITPVLEETSGESPDLRCWQERGTSHPLPQTLSEECAVGTGAQKAQTLLDNIIAQWPKKLGTKAPNSFPPVICQLHNCSLCIRFTEKLRCQHHLPASRWLWHLVRR